MGFHMCIAAQEHTSVMSGEGEGGEGGGGGEGEEGKGRTGGGVEGGSEEFT